MTSLAPDEGTRRRRFWLRRSLLGLLLLAVAGAVAAAVVLSNLVETVEENIERVPVEALDERRSGDPVNYLIVGSDSRDGLTEEQLLLYTLGLPGEVAGQRSDTVILVSVLGDGAAANVVSFPRDLYVDDGDARRKLTETFSGGPDSLVSVVQNNAAVSIHHYAEVAVPAFIAVVEEVGEVTICLEESLVDPASGANFRPGCQQMNPRSALAYVRSRQGNRGDFQRIERQQKFLKALLRELVDTSMLTDLPRLFGAVEAVAKTMTTDESLDVNSLRRLAQDLRGLADGDVPMVTVPGYLRRVGGKSFVIGYGPGVRSLFATIAAGKELAPRGEPISRAATGVAVWTDGRTTGGSIVRGTLRFSGFAVTAGGAGELPGGEVTTVYVVPGHEERALWVAATLGAPRQPLPDGLSLADDVHVVVVVGDDAQT